MAALDITLDPSEVNAIRKIVEQIPVRGSRYPEA